jgi:hypothetical protein
MVNAMLIGGALVLILLGCLIWLSADREAQTPEWFAEERKQGRREPAPKVVTDLKAEIRACVKKNKRRRRR